MNNTATSPDSTNPDAPDPEQPPSTDSPPPSQLTLDVREFITRLGTEAALLRFQEDPPPPGRPLTVERVQEVAAGEAEPTYRMAEVVFEERQREPAACSVAPPPPPRPPPAPVQPWVKLPPTYEPVPVQPWMQ